MQTLRVDAVLAHTDPPIHRRLDLSSDLRLSEVHHVLQAAFDWTDSHLHEFSQGGKRWDDGSDGALPERKTRLGQVLARVGDELEYTYDFGDSWLHVITVEEVRSREPGAPKAVLLAADQVAPPDDCGGIPGYYALLDALADPGNPEHADLVAWAAEIYGASLDDFDPSRVDVEALGRRVQQAAG